ncbi:hypothetical protein L2E82_43663 [Cichorium intybus]|uniref:Uncharacterized protein n=1 Tax=Cichorium intybus TaxID=13427 RepID=A0ACB8ZPW7_CICIN|nr:hypothetical protein L2E82_43663 [Cichorium intybus]
MVEDERFTVGVVEYTDDWSPFHPLPFDKVEEDNDESDEDDEDGISDTWENPIGDDQEFEEGEIRDGDQPDVDEDLAIDGDDRSRNSNGQLNKCAMEIEESVGICANNNGGENQGQFQMENNGIEAGIILNKKEKQVIVSDNSQNNQSNNKNIIGSVEKLVPMGCFGPFPSMAGPYNQALESPPRDLPRDLPIGVDKSRILGSGIKRRRTDDANFISTPCRLSFDNEDRNNKSTPFEGNNSKTVDLNHEPSISDSADTWGSYANEISDTIEVGKQVRFQIDGSIEILNEIMGAQGDSIDHK